MTAGSAASVTVVRGGSVWTGGANPRTLSSHDLVIEDGVVVAIEPSYRGRSDIEIDAGGCMVAPGLINAHVHPGATPRARSVAEDLPIASDAAFYHAVGGLLRTGVEEMTPDEFMAIMEWDAVAMLLGGATTIVAEMIVPASAGVHLQWADIVGRFGFRGQLGLTYPNKLGAIGFVQDGKIVSTDAGDVAAAMEDGLRLHDTHDGACDGRLRIHLSPHGSETVPEEVLRATARACAERGINAHMHLAQHMAEYRAIEQRYGKSPVQYLHDIGFLGPHVMATHVTYVDDADIAILADTGVHVVHAAYRKAKEAITSPFHEFLTKGVNVAIATDSFSHDLILDLKLACLLGKVRGGSVAQPTAHQALSAATHGAARALRRPDLGTLEPGARGDVIVIALDGPFAAPVFDPVRALVYYATAADIRHTLVDGRPVVRNGKVEGVDMAALHARVKDACERLWSLAAERNVLPEGVTYTPFHTCSCGHH
jgi:5-methylthioadenosine/S-adenosylhomocysteine deaminase